MDCPNCGTANPPQARFCMNCGQPLTVACPNCGTELPRVANFCFNCGHRMADRSETPAPMTPVSGTPASNSPVPTTVAPWSNLQRYMPQELRDKLDAARRRKERVGDRRVITILFTDVSGSTAMARRFDPEKWAEIMDEAFDYLIPPVYRYEGIVARLMGDGLLAFFGAPLAHEDDPVRAVLAGLDIVRGINTYGRYTEQEYGLSFNVRVGINTGPVVVGQVGSDLAVEYTAMGDAINIASRMETMALPGTVQITADTYKLVAPLFDVWEVGPLEVKGKPEPVLAYRVLGWQAEPGHTRGLEGLEVPLIGRQSELEQLHAALDYLKDGRGGVVSLVGEAGLGKTRLVEELADRGRALDLLWLVSRGVSYEASRPYGLFLAFIRQNFGIREHDAPEVVRAKIARGTAALELDQRALMARVVKAVLGVGDGDDAPQVGAEGFKRELFATLYGATRATAMRRPTVMVCEDLHWIDAESVELLFHLLQLVEEVPLLFLCTYRPYREGPAERIRTCLEQEHARHHSKIRLQPLTEEESDQLVMHLLDIKDLSKPLRVAILAKTEGNPFFVEEVVRSLIEAGQVGPDGDGARLDDATLIEELGIPDNVQSLLIARIDRLDEPTRRTLQLAAVIGRTFPYRVLKRLVGTAVELDKHLDRLGGAGLIREVTQGPEPVYAFRHSLTRDAAYASILHRQRREFHRQVASAVEALYKDRLEEEAHRLAEHYIEAGDRRRALGYYRMAGDHAARVHAITAAVEHYGRAIEVARRAQGGAQELEVDRDRLIYLYKQRGRTLELGGRYDEALANYGELERLAQERQDPRLELAAVIPQATLQSTFTAKFNPRRGRALSERALALAQALGDRRAEARTLWNLMLLALFADDDRAQALVHGEAALALARRHDLREELAYILHDIANVYLDVGRDDEAWWAYLEAGELWQDLENLPMQVDNLANSAWHPYQAGRLDEALARATEALRISRSIGSLWGQAYSLMTLGPLYLADGTYAEGVQVLEEAIPLAEQANFTVSDEIRVALGGIFGFFGDLGRARELIERVRAQSDLPKDRLLASTMLAQVYLRHAQLAQARGAFEEAQEQFQAGTVNPTLSMYRMVAPVIGAELALEEGDHAGALGAVNVALRHVRRRSVMADLLRIKGQALFALGRDDDAYSSLLQAQVAVDTPDADRMTWLILTNLWSRRTLGKLLLLQGRIEARRGNRSAAQTAVQEAQEMVRATAASVDALGLQEAYLALQDVRAVLEGIAEVAS